LTLQTNKQLVGAVVQSGSVITYGATSLAETIYNGTNIIQYLNGTSNSSGSTNLPFSGAGTTSIGINNWFGTINEIVVYNTSLTILQRQQIEGYLAWKWGLQSKLPSSHPYSLFPPS
jgi:hypothetical protein